MAGDPMLAAMRVLEHAQSGRLILQDFRPLSDSLEWELGQEYLRQRGSLAFIGDPEPVPFVVNNDGNLSVRAAAVFFTSLMEAEQAGTLPQDLFVLELGIGVGLFARFFLDELARLCAAGGKDYYHRLTYIAADRSERMLRDAARRGIFQNHPGRYRLRLIDALQPATGLLRDGDIVAQGQRPLQAVFLNYLLDCLPACVVRVDGERLEELHVRTSLPEGQGWRSLTNVDADELRRLASLPDAARQAAIQAVYPLCLSEYRFRPLRAEDLPMADLVLERARQAPGKPILHNHGALTCLEALLGQLAEGGFILIADYGQTQQTTNEEFEHQRFSQATFVGVNFPLLAAQFGTRPELRWSEPDEGEVALHCRLLGRGTAVQTLRAFQELGNAQALAGREEAVRRARQLARAGRPRAALGLYAEALTHQPYSWPLMSELAHLLTFEMRNPRAGLGMARLALTHNPACSAELWNVLGDSLFELGRLEESHRAFERALLISPEDVRARFNLSFVHAKKREFAQALVRIAEALGLDRSGAYRQRLLQKQSEVLALLSEQHQSRYLGQIDRVAAFSLPAGAEAERRREGHERGSRHTGGEDHGG